jgi:hypothetical protein
MYLLHAINCDRQTQMLNVLGRIAMYKEGRKKRTLNTYLMLVYGRNVSRITIHNHKVSENISVLMKIKLNPY